MSVCELLKVIDTESPAMVIYDSNTFCPVYMKDANIEVEDNPLFDTEVKMILYVGRYSIEFIADTLPFT